MACKKYSRLIANAALGGLNAARSGELREHLAQCAACSKEFEHAKAASAAMNRSMEALVAGEPSPQFVARLRARIANESVSAHPEWQTWIPVVCGGFAFAALLMALMIRAPHRDTGSVAPVAQNLPNPGAQVPTNMGKGAAEASQTLSRTKYRVARLREPEVLVPPGQLAAVMQFANAVNEGRIDGEQIAAAQEQSEKPIEIEAIQISPLNIPKLDSNGPAGSPGGY
jgi:hypothetical protein